jgi:hypothetical protein
MDPIITRAFLWRMLTKVQQLDLETCERLHLPPGRYFQGFEVCQRYRLNPKAVTEVQQREMERVAVLFSGILRAKRAAELIEDAKAMRAPESTEPLPTEAEALAMADGKIEFPDAGEWCRFAERHYHEPRTEKVGIGDVAGDFVGSR